MAETKQKRTLGRDVFVKVAKACGPDGLNERWASPKVSPTLNVFDNMGDVRAVVQIAEKRQC